MLFFVFITLLISPAIFYFLYLFFKSNKNETYDPYYMENQILSNITKIEQSLSVEHREDALRLFEKHLNKISENRSNKDNSLIRHISLKRQFNSDEAFYYAQWRTGCYEELELDENNQHTGRYLLKLSEEYTG